MNDRVIIEKFQTIRKYEKETEPRHAHMTDEDIAALKSQVEQAWLSSSSATIQKNIPPPVIIENPRSAREEFQNQINRIIDRLFIPTPPKQNKNVLAVNTTSESETIADDIPLHELLRLKNKLLAQLQRK